MKEEFSKFAFGRDAVLAELNRIGRLVGKDLMETALTRVEHEKRLQLFSDIMNSGLKVTDKAFYDGLRYAYTTGKWYDLDDYLFIDNCFERVELLRMLNKREKKLFDTLPETVEIYRGCCFCDDIEDLMGFSWTLKKEIADFFAYRFNQSNRAVYKTTINKNDMKALFMDRKEYDVVILGTTNDVELISQN